MKFNYKPILVSALAAATALTIFAGCGDTRTASASDTVSPTAELSVSLPAEAAVGTPAENSGAAAGYTAPAAESAASELFSDRDLSGEYDAQEAVSIRLTGSGAETDSAAVSVSGSTVTIGAAGTYLLSGTLENGSIIVDVDKEDKVQLVLDGVTVNSDSFAAIYVRQADKVFVTLAEGSVNVLSNGGTFTQIDSNNVDAVIFSKDDLTLNGTGTLRISSPGGHGIVGKDEVTVTGGSYEIAAASHAISGKDSIAVSGGSFMLGAGKDGLHSENDDDETLGNIYLTGGEFVIRVYDDGIHATNRLQIDGGKYDITAAEGLEGTYIQINDGTIDIQASDDGINAAHKSGASVPTVEFNGGTTTIVMGAGDTDAVDSNGNIVVNGGTIDITAQSGFDCDGTAQYNGGTIILNGQTLNSIPNQMMGGMGGMNGAGGMGGMNGANGTGGMGGMNGANGTGGMGARRGWRG